MSAHVIVRPSLPCPRPLSFSAIVATTTNARSDFFLRSGRHSRSACSCAKRAQRSFKTLKTSKSARSGKNGLQPHSSTRRFFVAIITPGYFGSPYCRTELEQFLDKEEQEGSLEFTIPLYFVETPGYSTESGDPLIARIARRQARDWTHFNVRRKITSELHMEIDSIARYISKRRLKLPSPNAGHPSTPDLGDEVSPVTESTRRPIWLPRVVAAFGTMIVCTAAYMFYRAEQDSRQTEPRSSHQEVSEHVPADLGVTPSPPAKENKGTAIRRRRTQKPAVRSKPAGRSKDPDIRTPVTDGQ